MHARAGTIPTPDVTWTNWELLTLDSGVSALSGNQYFQYRATLNTTNSSVSPEMLGFLLQFSNYSAGAGLESSVFDTGNTNNFLTALSWGENLNGYDVWLQVATSGDGINWDYCGSLDSNCSSGGWLDWSGGENYYFKDPGITLPWTLVDAQNDQFFKYKVWLTSNGTGSPIADDISITFDTAHLAVFASDAGTNTPTQPYTPTAGTPFDIVIEVNDSEGVSYTGHDHAVTLQLIASVPQLDTGLPYEICTSSFSANGTNGINTVFNTTGTYGATNAGELTISDVTLCQATETSFTIEARETSGGALTSKTSNSDLTITTVDVATPLELVFTTQPATFGVIGVDLNPSPEVTIQDKYGNVDTSAANDIILSAKDSGACSNAANGTLNATQVTASLGVAAFSNVNYDLSEQIFLYAEETPSGITPVCSGAVNIVGSGYVVQVNAVYDLTNDAIDITSSLLFEGSIVTTGNPNLVDVEILDGPPPSIADLSDMTLTPDTTNFVFHTTWEPGGLSAGTLYTIISHINHTGSGATYLSAPFSFKVDQLGNIKIGLNQLDTTLTGVQTTVGSIDTSAVTAKTAVAGLDTKISAHAASQAAYRAQTTTKIASIKTKIGSILEDTSTTFPDTIKATIATELAKGQFSEIVTTQAEVKYGDTISFRYRTISGLTPTVTVFDPKDVANGVRKCR